MEEEDPYVVYQLRKPHQRGTAVVPRLAPKSHLPAFSHANYRFARVGPADADDALLYLPKSLEYPTRWDSFGSDSSIWSGSSIASAFPTRPKRKSTVIESVQPRLQRREDDDLSSTRLSSRSATSMTERTSLLSSEGTRSLKSFIRFDAPSNAEALGALQAPVPIRRPFHEFEEPQLFMLPPALSEIEMEDEIVEQVLEEPLGDVHRGDVVPREKSHNSGKDTNGAHKERSRDRATNSITKKRRSMWAWLFSASSDRDDRSRGRKFSETVKHNSLARKSKEWIRARRMSRDKSREMLSAPTMDEEEEQKRREQFVKANKKQSIRRSVSRIKRSLSTRAVSMEAKRSIPEPLMAESDPDPRSKRKSWKVWSSIKLKKAEEDKENAENMVEPKVNDNMHLSKSSHERVASEGDRNVQRLSKEYEEARRAPNSNNSSFIKRKMAALRETTARRMAFAREEITGRTGSSAAHCRANDPAVPPRERKADRPRILSREKQGPSNTAAPVIPTLDQMFAARPELSAHASPESIEHLASRINSDLTYETTGSGSGASPTGGSPMGRGLKHADSIGLRELSSAVTSAPSSDGKRSYSEVSDGNQSPGDSSTAEYRLPNGTIVATRQAGATLRQPRYASSPSGTRGWFLNEQNAETRTVMGKHRAVKAGAVDNASENRVTKGRVQEVVSPGGGKSIFMDGGVPPPKSNNPCSTRLTPEPRKGCSSDYNHPHASQLEVFCQCNCSCVYEEECRTSCELIFGRASSKGSSEGGSAKEQRRSVKQNLRRNAVSDVEDANELFGNLPAPVSPSVNPPDASHRQADSVKAWQSTLRARVEAAKSPSTHPISSAVIGRTIIGSFTQKGTTESLFAVSAQDSSRDSGATSQRVAPKKIPKSRVEQSVERACAADETSMTAMREPVYVSKLDGECKSSTKSPASTNAVNGVPKTNILSKTAEALSGRRPLRSLKADASREAPVDSRTIDICHSGSFVQGCIQGCNRFTVSPESSSSPVESIRALHSPTSNADSRERFDDNRREHKAQGSTKGSSSSQKRRQRPRALQVPRDSNEAMKYVPAGRQTSQTKRSAFAEGETRTARSSAANNVSRQSPVSPNQHKVQRRDSKTRGRKGSHKALKYMPGGRQASHSKKIAFAHGESRTAQSPNTSHENRQSAFSPNQNKEQQQDSRTRRRKGAHRAWIF